MTKRIVFGLIVIAVFSSCVKSLESAGVMKWDLSSLDLPKMDYNGKTYYVHPDAGEMTYQDALAYCERLSAYNHDDWFLPGQQELSQMFQESEILGGFMYGGYWYENPYADNDLERYLSFQGGGLSSSGKGRVRPVRCENSFAPTLTLTQINDGNWSTFEVSVTQSSRYTIKKSGLCWSDKPNSKSRTMVTESDKKDGKFQVSISKALPKLQTMYLSAFSELSDGTTIYSNEISLAPHKPIVDFSLERKDDKTVKAIIEIKDWGFPELFDYIDVFLSNSQNDLSSAKRINIKESVYSYEGEWDMIEGTLYLVFNPFSKSVTNVNAVFSATINRETKAPQVKTLPVTNKTALGLDANTNIMYSMTLNCELLDIGYPEATSCGLVVSTSNSSPTIDSYERIFEEEASWSHPIEKKAYSFSDFQLTPNGPVYIRSFAISDINVSYGDITTVYFIEPSVSSVAVSSITTSSATLTSTVLESGDPQYTERGFIYLKKSEYDSNPSSAIRNHRHQSPIPNNNVVGDWDMQVSGLLPGNDYVAFSYVSEGGVIWYDSIVQFSTYQAPSVMTLPVNWENIDSYTYRVKFNGKIDNQADTFYIERGFIVGDWSSSANDKHNTFYAVSDLSQESFSFIYPKDYYSTTQYVSVWAYAKTSDGELYIGSRQTF